MLRGLLGYVRKYAAREWKEIQFVFLEVSVDKSVEKAKNFRTDVLRNVWECP
jgi:hypothetical protein